MWPRMSLQNPSSSKSHPFIDDYLKDIQVDNPQDYGEDMHACAKMVKEDLDLPGVWVDKEAVDDMVRVIETYMDMKLLPWELFICALIHAHIDQALLYTTFFLVIGRGNGKNGFISGLAFYFTTQNHGIKGYNVDIIANSQEQAMTSFDDVYHIIDEDAEGVLKDQFSLTKKIITNKHTGSYIKFNTSNAKTKDGKRSASLIFDELHEYENYRLINVFESAFGKKPNSRTFYITTNGYVREGPLDKQLTLARKVMNRETKSRLKMLPMIFKADSREDVLDPDKWIKANPSLPYFPALQEEMNAHFEVMQEVPEKEIEFYTKRMNLPAQDSLVAVATEDQILATNRPIPFDLLKGRPCIGGVDYALVNDFASVGLLFKMEGVFYLMEHTFVLEKALTIESRKIEAPVRLWAEQGLVTILNEEILRPEHLSRWFQEQMQTYDILDIKADDFKFPYIEAAFAKAGLPLTSVRTGERTHTQLSPTINAIFAEERLVMGDNPTMRWYIRNVYKEIKPNGNIVYKKIEQIKRKTDGFYMLTHALNGASELEEAEPMTLSMKPIFL